MIPAYIIGSVLAVSVASLAGVSLLALKEDLLKRILLPLVSFAVGALFANVFLHLLPEAVERSSDLTRTFGLALAGVVLSFIVEKFIHWHHCHNLDCHHERPVGTMMLIGDGVHNITDGILIAAAYLVDIRLGVATTIAVLLHEIPQEIGDFAVLLHSGYSRSKAIFWNLISALTALIGAALVLFLSAYAEGIGELLLPIAAGNFLYIAGSDLIPELHREGRFGHAAAQFVMILAGIALMYGLTLGEHRLVPEHEEGQSIEQTMEE